MLAFTARRLSFILLTCVLIVFFAHMGMSMIRNSEVREPDFHLAQLGVSAWNATRATLSRILHGDLGNARLDRRTVPVWEILKSAYGNSMGLLGVALLIGIVAGVAIGSMTALAKGKVCVVLLLGLTILGISTPTFFASLLLQVGELRFLATFGRRLVSMAGHGWDFEHMAMPVAVLAARPLAYLARTTFLGLRRVMEEDYIRTAYSKGLSLRRTVNVHALRNMGVPLLTACGVSVRFSLSALPVVEFFFVWPGLGRSLLEAINARQTAVVVALAAALGLTLLIINLLLDVIYRIVDPRLRGIP